MHLFKKLEDKIDSKAVTEEIRRVIKPFLQQNGFNHSSGRTFWRTSDKVIHVLNFQSFNPTLADNLRCTPHSFAINLGCYFPAIPADDLKIKEKGGQIFPEEYHCHIRRTLNSRAGKWTVKNKGVWYVDNAGKNLPSVMAKALGTIETDALPWFTEFSNDERVLAFFKEGFTKNTDGTWNWGSSGDSPGGNFCLGYFALSLNRTGLAKEALGKALPYYKAHSPEIAARIESDLKRL